jgi:hypothetical protein
MSVTLIPKLELNPNSDVKHLTRLSNEEFDQLISEINQFLIDHKDDGCARVIFGNNDLVLNTFPDSFIRLFDSEVVCKSTAKRFAKLLKHADYHFTQYVSRYTYWYNEFEIKW